jgi:hypothetical protein
MLGYDRVRVFWHMRIDLDEAPPPPVLDERITIRTFDRERDERAVYEALREAFEDHWGERVLLVRALGARRDRGRGFAL